MDNISCQLILAVQLDFQFQNQRPNQLNSSVYLFSTNAMILFPPNESNEVIHSVMTYFRSIDWFLLEFYRSTKENRDALYYQIYSSH